MVSKQQVLDVQQGIWIDVDWLKKAGLGPHVQVIVEEGEIHILAALPNVDQIQDEQDGWDVFLSLETGATPGRLVNASVNHDRYLYTQKL
jgi:hypothetical protein